MGAITGISEHSGWAELVTLGIGTGKPVLLDRRRAELIARGLPQNPFHHEGLALPLAEAEGAPAGRRERAAGVGRAR